VVPYFPFSHIIKKIAGAVYEEIQKEIGRMVGCYGAEKEQTGGFDLEIV
jgi:hypothetical protein